MNFPGLKAFLGADNQYSAFVAAWFVTLLTSQIREHGWVLFFVYFFSSTGLVFRGNFGLCG
ncbi:hypothetical protein HGG78_17940 [Vibrio aestuarianus]|uniref:hypothetical protein n=1 Tax=Vibrio aestuarianus TaxID=28171 RepID=UPI000C7B5DA6|nr:hypothetical protein [Vibrio aestuarianus]AUL95910.1 hypothetical protein FORC54_1765 [Vibrio vulnificus]NGZ15599.1 hypothetical protein [Vibrio aestuarianus]NKZ51747.1 hypothetical protein [Vibrio aestuarianus]